MICRPDKAEIQLFVVWIRGVGLYAEFQTMHLLYCYGIKILKSKVHSVVKYFDHAPLHSSTCRSSTDVNATPPCTELTCLPVEISNSLWVRPVFIFQMQRTFTIKTLIQAHTGTLKAAFLRHSTRGSSSSSMGGNTGDERGGSSGSW